MDPICILQTLNEASKATPNKFSTSLSMRSMYFYYEMGSFSSYYLPRYSHSKQRNDIFSLYLHHLHCKNNTNMNSGNILTCELVNLTKSILLSLYSMQKIMEDYGIIEHLRAGNKEMRVVDVKQNLFGMF